GRTGRPPPFHWRPGQPGVAHLGPAEPGSRSMGSQGAETVRFRAVSPGRKKSAMSSERRKRHLKILEIISTRPVQTQEELAAALTAEGWQVTQSSVSRDIAALGLIKA